MMTVNAAASIEGPVFRVALESDYLLPRSETVSAFSMALLNSPFLVIGTTLAFCVHMAAMHIPFMQHILQLEPVGLPTSGALVCLAMTVIAAMELHKWWRRKRK